MNDPPKWADYINRREAAKQSLLAILESAFGTANGEQVNGALNRASRLRPLSGFQRSRAGSSTSDMSAPAEWAASIEYRAYWIQSLTEVTSQHPDLTMESK